MSTERAGIECTQSPYCPLRVELAGQRAMLEDREKCEEFRGAEQPVSSPTTMCTERDAENGLKTTGDESCIKNTLPSPTSSDSDNDRPRFTPLPTIFTGALPPPVHPAITRKNLPSPNGCIDKPRAVNGAIRTLQERVARLDFSGQLPSTRAAGDAVDGATPNGASSPMHGSSTAWMVVQLAPVSSPLHLPPLPLPQQWRRSRFMPRARHLHDPNRVLLYGPEVNPLFEDEWCWHVNQRDLQTKLQEERAQRMDRDGNSTPQLSTAIESASGGVMPDVRRTLYSYVTMKMQRSGTRVWLESGSELASVIATWNEEARKNAPAFRGYASREPKTASWGRGQGGYTLDNSHTALKKFVKRRVVTIVRQFVKRRNVSSTCQEVQVEWTIRVPALDDLNVCFESCAANLRKASQLCSLRIVTGLYEHGLVKEADLEFNRSRKDFLRPERDLPMHLRPYLECSSSFFQEILHNIEQRHGGK